jgi:2-succinyl-5-enolpyruvyl-6-hydroxy-3-cyclohexene-1-carboxylate synthase
VAGVIDVTLGDRLSEPQVARRLAGWLPSEATLMVASSMPIRDLETFMPGDPRAPRILANRGANGIDGTLSTAFGLAALGKPVVLLTGDVALAHDIGGLLSARRLGLAVTIVLLNNDGGGIFDFLPVATAPMAHEGDGEGDVYTRHIATPTGLSFAAAAELYGAGHELVGDVHGFRAALERALIAPRTTVVEVRSGRTENLELHRRVWEAVSAAVRAAR